MDSKFSTINKEDSRGADIDGVLLTYGSDYRDLEDIVDRIHAEDSKTHIQIIDAKGEKDSLNESQEEWVQLHPR